MSSLSRDVSAAPAGSAPAGACAASGGGGRPVGSAWQRWYIRALPAYWVFLFVATHLPKLKLDGRIPRSDKLAHLVAFGLLAFFYWRFAEAVRQRPLDAGFAWRALIVIAAYGALDEWLQQFVGRSAHLYDWLADVIGAGVVLAMLEMRRRWSARRA